MFVPLHQQHREEKQLFVQKIAQILSFNQQKRIFTLWRQYSQNRKIKNIISSNAIAHYNRGLAQKSLISLSLYSRRRKEKKIIMGRAVEFYSRNCLIRGIRAFKLNALHKQEKRKEYADSYNKYLQFTVKNAFVSMLSAAVEMEKERKEAQIEKMMEKIRIRLDLGRKYAHKWMRYVQKKRSERGSM